MKYNFIINLLKLFLVGLFFIFIRTILQNLQTDKRMRNIITLFSLIIVLTLACKKAKCISELQNEISTDIHFERVSCSSPGVGDENFEWKFYTEESFKSYECSPSNIPFEFGFKGIIIAQGVKVPYVGPLGGDPGYSLDVELVKNECKKEIDFHFILTTIDTSRLLPHAESVIVVLNGIDSTYKINYSHEIIPYKE